MNATTNPLPAPPQLLALAISTLCLTFAQPAPAQSSSYRIAGGEVIDIVVFQENDLSNTYRVSADGRINMPLIGSVSLAGLTTNAASGKIRDHLLDGYLVNPQVTVRVAEHALLRYTVLGQVRTPGSLSVPSNQKVDLFQAIGSAGGFTRLANPRKVVIKREIAGRMTVFTVDAKALAADAGSEAPQIRTGDVITVSESRF